LQRDKDEHDHTRETGLAVVTRRSLRALADTPQQTATCTQTNRDPARHAHASQIQRWPAPCGNAQATEPTHAGPGYARGRLARPSHSFKAVRACTCKPIAFKARAPAVQTRATRLHTGHQASPAYPSCARDLQARPSHPSDLPDAHTKVDLGRRWVQ
jgi:hypothetical protein